MDEYVFLDRINDRFGEKNISYYREDPDRGTVKFTIYQEGITFGELSFLADLFGTDQINFQGETQTGYCSTCAGTDPPEIEAEGVKFP